MTSKRGAGKVRKSDKGEKAKTTSDASGGKSVREKTRTTAFFQWSSKVFTVRSSRLREKCITRMEQSNDLALRMTS